MTLDNMRPLRVAVLGDLESIHTRRWLAAFAERGHDMHAVSFYQPRLELPAGVSLHVLRPGDVGTTGGTSAGSGLRGRIPASLLRPVHGVRYQRAGLKQVLQQIAPDVVHAHYVVEYGFYAALTGVRPLVLSAWGSDVFVAPKQPAANLIARWTVRRADIVTANDPAMLAAVRRLGARPQRSDLVRIGALEELFFDQQPLSVNETPGHGPLTIVSTRALEPLYNVDVILRAFARVVERMPSVRLLIAHDGNQAPALRELAQQLELRESVQFLGRLSPLQVRDLLSESHVYVSVPSSDSMAASTLEAMARGAFPVVSDLPSLDGMVDQVQNGLRVTPGDVDGLFYALQRALVDAELRRSAARNNRQRVEAEGRLGTQVDRMEQVFRTLRDR